MEAPVLSDVPPTVSYCETVTPLVKDFMTEKP
jgi:hypothetical protein